MTQSKKDDTITIDVSTMNDGSYWTGDSIDITIADSDTSNFTFDISSLTSDTIDLSNLDLTSSTYTYADLTINPDEVERMCNEYPALEKVWRNFKSVYDMVKQDYEGKKKSGEIDDDIPF